jgi:hypothetical protein
MTAMDPPGSRRRIHTTPTEDIVTVTEDGGRRLNNTDHALGTVA